MMEKDYIPKSLEEAIEYLETHNDPKDLEEWKALDEDSEDNDIILKHETEGTNIISFFMIDELYKYLKKQERV